MSEPAAASPGLTRAGPAQLGRRFEDGGQRGSVEGGEAESGEVVRGGLGEQRDRRRDLVDPPERGVGDQPSDAVTAPGGIDDGRPEQERGVRTGAVPFQRDRPDHGVADIGDEDDASARPSRGSPAPAIRARTVIAPRHGWGGKD
jgi:hypothetical protein